MARISACAALLALVACAQAQFFADIFQNYQPFLTNVPTLRPIYDDKSRTKTEVKNYRGTTKYETDRNENRRNSGIVPISSIEEPVRRRKTTANVMTTTVKPRRVYTGRRVISNGRGNTENNDNEKEYDGKVNSISYTQNSNYDNNNRDYERRNNDYDQDNNDYTRNNYYTTRNPFTRPGVRPAVVDDRPPITNRPFTRPNDGDAIAFPGGGDSPQVIIGPDEDLMTNAEKKRYVDLAERMCDKYKALTTKAVQAIPLLPSPEPVRVNVSACSPVNVPLIVGGRVVKINEFPHMTLLGWRKLETAGYSWKCGGSLVSDQFVLTAAHCSYQDRDNTVVDGPPRAVQVGSSYLDDPGALVVRVAAVIRHPKYKPPKSYYDLALVKLATPVKFSEVIKPACLGVPPSPGQTIIATGWGRTEYGGDQSHELRSVSLPIWSMEKCREVLGTSRKLPDGPAAGSQVCAGEARGGKDTCQGDSGGPAQLQDGCIWRVVAVTSLGRACGAVETPGVYAIAARAFISSQVFGNLDNNKPGSGYDNNNRESIASSGYDIDNNRRASGAGFDNNRRPGSGYDNNNRQSTANSGYDSGNNRQSNSNSGYDSGNNRQSNANNGYDIDNNRRASGVYGDRQNVPNYGNNQNNNVNYKPNNQVYSTARPDRDTVNNYGAGQNYDTRKPNLGSNGYTQKPDSQNGGIVFNNDDLSPNQYTTKRPTQNYYSQINDQTSYDRNSDNDNSNNQSIQNNRRHDSYTINRPWWNK